MIGVASYGFPVSCGEAAGTTGRERPAGSL